MPEDRLLCVESNRVLGASYHLISLSLDSDPPPWEPGQFAMISTGAEHDPLLRRPYSIHNLHDPSAPRRPLQFLYKVHGRGSALLSDARRGDRLSCLFPLGRGFAPEITGGQQLVLVAGGAGVASLHPLAAAELRSGRSPLLLFGARGTAELAAADPTRALGVEMLISTDDGSVGKKGFVSDLLDAELEKRGPDGMIVCACGPTPMMKATADVARRHGARCYLSLESMMACGFGVCVGCVVGVRREGGSPLSYLRTCIEGPVMDASEVVW